MATSAADGNAQPDWDALARSLNVGSAAEAQQRAYEIASFVARIETDKNKMLVLKTGNQYLELGLKGKN